MSAVVVMQGGETQGKVQKLSKGEVLMLNIGSMCTGARVIAVSLHVIVVTAAVWTMIDGPSLG